MKAMKKIAILAILIISAALTSCQNSTLVDSGGDIIIPRPGTFELPHVLYQLLSTEPRLHFEREGEWKELELIASHFDNPSGRIVTPTHVANDDSSIATWRVVNGKIRITAGGTPGFSKITFYFQDGGVEKWVSVPVERFGSYRLPHRYLFTSANPNNVDVRNGKNQRAIITKQFLDGNNEIVRNPRSKSSNPTVAVASNDTVKFGATFGFAVITFYVTDNSIEDSVQVLVVKEGSGGIALPHILYELKASKARVRFARAGEKQEVQFLACYFDNPTGRLVTPTQAVSEDSAIAYWGGDEVVAGSKPGYTEIMFIQIENGVIKFIIVPVERPLTADQKPPTDLLGLSTNPIYAEWMGIDVVSLTFTAHFYDRDSIVVPQKNSSSAPNIAEGMGSKLRFNADYGYSVVTYQYEHGSKKTNTQVIAIKRRTGIVVSVINGDAKVIIDRLGEQSAPANWSGIEPGIYKGRVEKVGFKTARFGIELDRGTIANLAITLLRDSPAPADSAILWYGDESVSPHHLENVLGVFPGLAKAKRVKAKLQYDGDQFKERSRFKFIGQKTGHTVWSREIEDQGEGVFLTLLAENLRDEPYEVVMYCLEEDVYPNSTHIRELIAY